MKIVKLLSSVAVVMGLTLGSSLAADIYYEGLPGVVKHNYIGVTGGVGHSTSKNGKGTVGAIIGTQANDNLALEAQYEYRDSNDHLVTGNALLGTQMGVIYPYVLAGAGYKWTSDKDAPVYVVGAGVKKSLTNDIDLDARYRYVKSFDNSLSGDNRWTLGLNLKF